MRKKLCISWVIASDAACIIAGFIAGAVVIQLLQTASYPGAMSRLFPTLQVNFADSGGEVNRARKGDRLDRIQFGDRFGELFWAAPGDRTPLLLGDHSGRVLFWLSPGVNTTIVPKGVISFDRLGQPGLGPRPESPDKRKQQLIPTKIVGCEPVASSLVEPDLARFAGRCVAQLRALADGAGE
jgi:hypothetical protein